MKYYAVKPLNVIARELAECGASFEYSAGPTARSKYLWASTGVAEVKQIWARQLAAGTRIAWSYLRDSRRRQTAAHCVLER